LASINGGPLLDRGDQWLDLTSSTGDHHARLKQQKGDGRQVNGLGANIVGWAATAIMFAAAIACF